MTLLAMTVRRIIQLIPILLGITVISFLLLRLVPGDPARQILGQIYTPELGEEVRESLGLNLPLWQQFWDFFRSAVVGDFGESYTNQQSVRSLIGQSAGATLFLIVMAALLTAVLAIPLGLLSGLRSGGAFDQGTRVFLLVGYALPSFLLGIVFLLILGVKIPIFPISGYGNGFSDHVYHLLLPAVTLAIGFSTVLVRSLRSSVIEIASSDYVIIARLKGISPRRVATHHILHNGMVSVVTVFGVNLAFLVGGTVVVEKVFAIPGVGTLLVDSTTTRDFPVVQALTLLFAVLVVAVNLVTDVVHVALDPRLNTAAG